MNVRFLKDVTVDYEEARTGEIKDTSFNKGRKLKNVALERLSKNFVNIHLENGDLIISVPSNAIYVEE